MGVWRKVRENISDVLTLGPSFLLRHLPHLSGAELARIKIPSIGTVYVRASESDAMTFRQVFAHRDYDLGATSPVTARLQQRYRSILDTGKIPVIIDAGANVGAASLWFQMQFPEAVVVAIEPEPGNAQILRRNLAGRKNFVVIEAAIGSESGFVAIENEGHGWGARTVRTDSGVSLITIDDARKTVPDGTLFAVKVDIEGFESDLFSANVDWLDDAYLVAIEPHDWMLPGKHSSGSFQQAMGSRNFEIFISGENLIYVRN